MRTRGGLCHRIGLVLCLLICAGGMIPGAYSDGGERVADIDGNVYGTVRIGNQVWMTENLRVTRYNDGTKIPLVSTPNDWRSNSSQPAFSWYDNDASNRKEYGALYNWFAVETGKLCPPGWRVPAQEDWDELSAFLKQSGRDAGALRTAGTDFWDAPNDGATNSTGFSALPGGYCWWRGVSLEKGLCGYFWTSTEASDTHAWSRTIRADKNKVYRSLFYKREGFSVRAIKE